MEPGVLNFENFALHREVVCWFRSMAVLDDIYNAFNPMPLPAGSPQYVDFTAVRGGSDVSIELGRKVQRSSEPTCQLFSGHLGGGNRRSCLS